jgi:hypothetical protein
LEELSGGGVALARSGVAETAFTPRLVLGMVTGLVDTAWSERVTVALGIDLVNVRPKFKEAVVCGISDAAAAVTSNRYRVSRNGFAAVLGDSRRTHFCLLAEIAANNGMSIWFWLNPRLMATRRFS